MNTRAVITRLRSHGHRISRAREAIIAIFSTATTPLTAVDIRETLIKTGITVNKTTVYRELEFLKTQNLLKEVHLTPGIAHYESALQHHHHHLICTGCNKIEAIDPTELEKSISNLTSRLRTTNDFMIADHTLEFFGRCATCQ